MRRQKGQAIIEFALIMPLFFAMCFGMIYGGMTFLDYLQFNNAARGVAREISLITDDVKRNEIADEFENNNSKYVSRLTKLYTPTMTVKRPIINDIRIEIKFTLNEKNLPIILKWLEFPPKTLRPIEIVMPLESSKE